MTKVIKQGRFDTKTKTASFSLDEASDNMLNEISEWLCESKSSIVREGIKLVYEKEFGSGGPRVGGSCGLTEVQVRKIVEIVLEEIGK